MPFFHGLRCAAAGLAALSCAATTALAAPKAEPVVTAVIERFIRPAYADFREAADASLAATSQLCEAPSGPHLADARAGFERLARAWARAEVIRFGPVTEENRLERILYWPDRKGIGLKQVQAALAAEDATVADAASLAGKSVAMQGLGALEFVLYGTGSDALSGADGGFRCRYAAAIGSNLAGIAAAVAAGWKADAAFPQAWLAPGDANPLFRDDGEAVGEAFEIFVNGLELLRDVRFGSFLGAGPDGDKPRSALFWRSAQTVPTMIGNLQAMRDAFAASGLGAALPADLGWLPGSIDFEFGNALSALEAAEGPIDDVLADPERRGKLAYAVIVTSSLSDLFGVRLAGGLGLSAGFSSLDGD